MSDLAPPLSESNASQHGKHAQPSLREQVRQRVRHYKRVLTLAAILGFSAFGVLIGHPSVTTTTTTSSNGTSTSSPSSSNGSFFNPSGGNINGTGTSAQPPATTSSAS